MLILLEGELVKYIIGVDFNKFFHSFLIVTVIGNLGFFFTITRFIAKYFSRYKNAVWMYIEEHEALVEDYIQRHPELKNSQPQTSIPRFRSRESQSTHKGFTEIFKRTSPRISDDDEPSD